MADRERDTPSKHLLDYLRERQKDPGAGGRDAEMLAYAQSLVASHDDLYAERSEPVAALEAALEFIEQKYPASSAEALSADRAGKPPVGEVGPIVLTIRAALAKAKGETT